MAHVQQETHTQDATRHGAVARLQHLRVKVERDGRKSEGVPRFVVAVVVAVLLLYPE